MSIGLYDMDSTAYLLVPPNLEIMKLSTYYKRKREVVVLSPSFSPEKNTQFFMRKDYNDGVFPKNIEKSQYGGLSFTDNIYRPLPMEIEECCPDPYIYQPIVKRIEEECTNAAIGKKLIHDIFSGEHLRLSLDGKTIWPNYHKQFRKLHGAKSIIFHDYNLSEIEGSYDEIRKIIAEATNNKVPVRVGSKFPIQIDTPSELMKWSSLPTNGLFFGITYKGVPSEEDFIKYASSNFDRAAFQLTNFLVTANCPSEAYFVKELLPRLLRLSIISRIYRIKISLTYDDDFFLDERWKRVIDLFTFFIHGADMCHVDALADTTMFIFCKFLKDKKRWDESTITKQEAREIFYFVQEKNPELFSMFYNCSYMTMGQKREKSGMEERK